MSDPGYIPTLLELVREHALRAVLPLTDLDQRILSEQREAFAEAGATVVASEPEVCDRCADKHAAARFFDANGIPSPRTWLPEDLPPYDELRFPVLVKSRRGFGSRDIYRCKDAQELEFFLGYTAGAVDGAGGVRRRGVLDRRAVRPRRPLPRRDPALDDRVEGRRVDQGQHPRRSRACVAFGAQVAETLPIRGPATIQCFRTAHGRHEVTDVNPRFGGAFPLPLAAGGALPVARPGARTRRAHRAAPRAPTGPAS